MSDQNTQQPTPPVGTIILDEVLEAMALHLTTQAPERGGLLFGPRGQKMITLFIPDLHAEHHFGTYTPSAEICRKSPEIEMQHGLEYKGVIHSHPGSMDHPSRPDLENARNALERNPQLAYFMMPIVTLGRFHESDLASHEALLPGGKLSHWLVNQSFSRPQRVLRRDRVSVITLWSDLKKFANQLPGKPPVSTTSLLDIEGVNAAVYLLESDRGKWMFAAAPGYPFIPPLVVPPDDTPSPTGLSWDLTLPADVRFASAMAGIWHNPPRLAPPVSQRPKSLKRSASRRRRDKALLFLGALTACTAIGSFCGTWAGGLMPLRITNTAHLEISDLAQLTTPAPLAVLPSPLLIWQNEVSPQEIERPVAYLPDILTISFPEEMPPIEHTVIITEDASTDAPVDWPNDYFNNLSSDFHPWITLLKNR